MKHFDRDAVAAALPWHELVAALRAGFSRGCTMPVRHHHEVEVPGGKDGILLLMPAWSPGGYLGLKMASAFPGNPASGLDTIQATYVLARATTGEPVASFDGGEITARRTTAASALASSYLAPAGAKRLLVVGTGRLAPLAAEAQASVRPIRHIEIWGRDEAKAAAVCETVREALPDADVEVCANLEASVAQADVTSCVTSSGSPLVRGAWRKPGSHLDLVGSFRREMREADDEAVAESSVFVDEREGALSESGELLHAIDSGAFRPADIRADLAQLCRQEHPGRTDAAERTLFKSVGVALEDLVAAVAVFEKTAGAS